MNAECISPSSGLKYRVMQLNLHYSTVKKHLNEICFSDHKKKFLAITQYAQYICFNRILVNVHCFDVKMTCLNILYYKANL